ncbi:MAG: chemotaxis protein CheD [Candidatus Hinthialibacter antarcticus]|nr:chemotaxis protein CheD [Candidatus Hinthialibacter antarcticus]
MTQALNQTSMFPDAKKQYVVGISDLKAVRAFEGTIVTHSLGSCLGVTVFDMEAKVGGMLHALLPDSSHNPARAQAKPGMFVDSGFESLIQAVVRLGANPQRLIIKLAGAGNFLDKQGHFQIGKKNYEMICAVLQHRRFVARGDDCGGAKPRSLYLDLKTGVTKIRSRGEEYEI